MAPLTIYGFAPSTYTRTARMYCVEKGVEHDLNSDFEMGSEDHKKLHPFGKIPIMQHDDIRLYETAAIGRYIDETFDGPALQPSDTRAGGVMGQWISSLTDYMYPVLIGGLVLPRLVSPSQGVEPDEAAISANMPTVEAHLSILDHGLSQSDYLAGDAPSLADWMAEPIISYVNMTPEGGPIVDKSTALKAWLQRMTSRASFAATQPPMPSAAE